MAKKRRRMNEKAAEETYEFVPPEFDEKEFLLKDIYGTKVFMVVTLIAVAIGIVASCIQKFSGDFWFVGLLLIVLAMAGLKQLLTLFRFRAELVEQKMLMGNYILLFLLSLGIWIMLLNPPFA